jgi:alpha-glucosidase
VLSEWWRRAVFYEIYVRSFQDSNGDGVGDLNGITSRLDYLIDLGIDAIWITPFYPSPQVDFGYDVSDYEDVDPLFGALGDFDRLVGEAHSRNIKVVLDLVVNHTSDQHPFYLESKRSRSSRYRDWYIWRDGRSGGAAPNNWESAFGGSAWTADPVTDQWYYHFFYPEQPDLNWRNPDVERWMFDVVKFWIDRGVDGFRLDAVNTLFEDPEMRDNPSLPEPRVKLTGVVTQEFVHTRGLPEMHGVLRRLRRFVEAHGRDVLLVSEAYVDTIADLVRFYGGGDQIHLPFNFFLAQVPELDASTFRVIVAEIESAFADAADAVNARAESVDPAGGRWPSLVLSNHDIERACDRFANDTNRDEIARVLAAMLLTLRGTPFIYYGEELALRTETPRRIDDVRDPVGKTFWPVYKGRDGVRTPMPWDDSASAGFTDGTPWLPVSDDARSRNVARQRQTPGSVLNFFRALIELRRRTPALLDGRYRPVGAHAAVFGYVRERGSESALVLLNMSDARSEFRLEYPGVIGRRWRVVLGTHRMVGDVFDHDSLALAPFEIIVCEAIGGSD